MPNTRTLKLVRQRTLPRDGSRTLSFSAFLGSRSRGHLFFKPHEVPEFEGEEAWFEVERVNGCWRVVRQV